MKNLLVISTTGMGDCLWGTPGIRALKKSVPEAGIDLLIRPQWESLYCRNPHIRHLIPYHPQWYRQLILLPRLLGTRYDHILIFHANKDIRRLLPWLRCSSIWAHQNLPNILPDRRLRFEHATHPILRRMALLEKIGVPADGTQMDIFFTDDERAETLAFLHQNRMASGEFVYLNVGASLPHKRWPAERMVSLAKLILKNTSLALVLGGGPNDSDQIDLIKNQLDRERVTRACHRSVRANCALIAQARLMVTTDTGPMHIGFAVKVPTIALFGPTRPEDSGPCQIESSLCTVIRSDALDNKNDARTVESNFFDSISATMVWEKAEAVLRETENRT